MLAATIVLVRTPSLSAAASYYQSILVPTWAPVDWDLILLAVWATIAIVVGDRREHRIEVAEGQADPPTLPRILLWASMVLAIVVFSGTAAQPFHYFQF